MRSCVCAERSRRSPPVQSTVTDDETRASALPLVRKLSGMKRSSLANSTAFDRAVDDLAEVARRLVHSIATSAPPSNRDDEMRKALERSRQRFGSPSAVKAPTDRSVRYPR